MVGTKDDQIKIRGIEDYTIPSAEREFTVLEDDEKSGNESSLKRLILIILIT